MKPFEQQTYYELLEIPVTAPEDEIRAAYARAIETYSPDSVAIYTLVDPGQIDALRARLTEAMEILTEPDLRAEYDRMIGVSGAEPSAVATLTPALAAAAQASESQEASAAEPQAESPPESKPSTVVASPEPVHETPSVPAAPPPVEVPAPAAAAAPAAPEPAPAPTVAPAAAPAEPAVPPAPAAPVAPVVMPGVVSPSQIHAAFRSYAISYVPVLVPAPSPAGAAFISPFAPGAQASAPQPVQEAPQEAKAPETAAPTAPATAPASGGMPSSTPQPTSEPSAPANTTEGPAASASASTTAPAPAPVAEPVPVAPVASEAPRSAPAQASVEPPPPEPVPAPASPEQAGAVLVHNEADELSGMSAPVPSRGPARAPTPEPQGTPASGPRVGARKIGTTPPPLPPGARRFTRGPGVQPGAPAGEAAKESPRPGQSTGMNLEEAQHIAQESAIATAEAALAQVAAKAREPRPKPIDLPPHTEFNGELLRRVRESRGMSLSQLAERTRISSKHLENIEADRYAALPATVYLRGMLMSVARELTLDPLRVSRSYLALVTAPKNK